jgi:hypothetical protein
VSIAFGAVAGTATFNAMAWFASGAGVSFAQAHLVVAQNPLYFIFFFGSAIVAGVLGGWVAAKLSANRPFVNAVISALFVMGWSAVLFASPLSEVTFEAITLLPAFVFPAPCALLGAYLYSLGRRDA